MCCFIIHRRERLEQQRKQTKKKWNKSPSDTEQHTHILEKRQSTTSLGEKPRLIKQKVIGIDVSCQVTEMDIDISMIKTSFDPRMTSRVVTGRMAISGKEVSECEKQLKCNTHVLENRPRYGSVTSEPTTPTNNHTRKISEGIPMSAIIINNTSIICMCTQTIKFFI